MKWSITSSILATFVVLIFGGCSPTNTSMPVIPSSTVQNIQQTSDLPPLNVNATPTIYKLPSPTALPIVSSANGKQILIEFLQNNGGCQLPCLLGLTPGGSVEEVRKLIEFFDKGASNVANEEDSLEVHNYLDSIVRRGSSSSSALTFWSNRLMTQFNIDFFSTDDNKIEQINLSSGSWQLSGQNENKVSAIVYGDKSYSELTDFFLLNRILNIYGVPQQILILPFPDDPGHPSPPAHYPFSFVLYYPDKGFLIEYSSSRDEQNGYYIGCPPESHIAVSVWDSDRVSTIEDVVKDFSNIYGINAATINDYKLIQDVTSFDPDSFYETFKAQTNECVQSPKSLWMP